MKLTKSWIGGEILKHFAMFSKIISIEGDNVGRACEKIVVHMLYQFAFYFRSEYWDIKGLAHCCILDVDIVDEVLQNI